MRVVEWISYPLAEKYPESPLGSLGGWFGMKDPDRWRDYLEVWHESVHPYCEAFREEVLRLSLKRGGFWHQSDKPGVPVFDDGTVPLFSMRAWGDIMAAIWSEEEATNYNYCQFAWYTAEEDAAAAPEPDHG